MPALNPSKKPVTVGELRSLLAGFPPTWEVWYWNGSDHYAPLTSVTPTEWRNEGPIIVEFK